MTHTMNITYRCKKQVTRLMATCTQGATKVYPRCTQALGRLMSMLRSSLGAGKEQLRSSLGAAKEHQRSTKGAPKEHQRSTKGAPWSMPTLCLRSAVMVILMMVVGVNGALAQDNYSGTYYIRSTGKNASNTNLYYLCPTENWYFYEATNKYAETDNGYPFLTTYKIKAHDDYDISKAVWSIEKHPSETDCYYIKQLKTGRYLVSNGQITGSSNANRVRVHLEAVADAAALTALGDMALFEQMVIIWIFYLTLRLEEMAIINIWSLTTVTMTSLMLKIQKQILSMVNMVKEQEVLSVFTSTRTMPNFRLKRPSCHQPSLMTKQQVLQP